MQNCNKLSKKLFILDNKKNIDCLKIQKWAANKQDYSTTFQKNCYLLDWKLFKNDQKYFLFRLESSFRSHDI